MRVGGVGRVTAEADVNHHGGAGLDEKVAVVHAALVQWDAFVLEATVTQPNEPVTSAGRRQISTAFSTCCVVLGHQQCRRKGY